PADRQQKNRAAVAHLANDLAVFRFIADKKPSLEGRKKRRNHHEEQGSGERPARRHSQAQPLDVTAFKQVTECCRELACAVLESEYEWTFRRRTKDVGSYRGHSADSQQRR